MNREMIKFALLFACAGACIAVSLALVAFAARSWLQPDPSRNYVLEKITLVLWPSSFWLMATEGASSITSVVIIALAVAANFLLYGVVGIVLKLMYSLLKRA